MKNYLRLLLILIAATIMFQGFQCSSREMTTAKVAMDRGDIPSAIENLQKEISKNPKNGEAYILLAELMSKQGKIDESIALMEKAEEFVAGNPQLKNKPTEFKFSLFKKAIEDGQDAFTRYQQDTKKVKQLDNALKNYNLAVKLRPYFFEGWRRIGLVYELQEKQDSALIAYDKYIEVLQPSIDVAKSHNFFVGKKIQDLPSIGKGTEIRSAKLKNGDSTILSKYVVNNKDLFVLSFIKNGEKDAKVASWSYDPPSNILQGERELVPDNITHPITSLATIYYNKNSKEKSLEYFDLVSILNPSDADANSALVTLYQDLGKGDAAIEAINKNIQKNPDNPTFIAQLGDLYMGKGDFDNAIKQYELALKNKPDFDGALRNVATCYGNKAAKLQQEQIELVNAKKIKQVDIAVYTPDLEKAADYFVKCLATEKFKNDADVLGDLCNIYMAMLPKEQVKFDNTLRQLEALEASLPKEKQEAFYYKLYKIYGQIQSPKITDIENKINELK